MITNNTQGGNETFDDDARIVVIKHFFADSKAHLYAARLKEVGIPSFISDSNIMTVLPLGGGGGIGLNVREKDVASAQRIISQLDLQFNSHKEEDFKDIDEEEIAYLKALQERQGNNKNWNLLLWLVLFFAVLLVLRAFLRAAGVVESWRDFF